LTLFQRARRQPRAFLEMDNTGAAAAAGATATFTKLRAVVADGNGDHSVELLVASQMLIEAEFNLTRPALVIG
jgi:hypothetical protein